MLSPGTQARRKKKIAMYKKYKQIAESMGPGVTVEDVKVSFAKVF